MTTHAEELAHYASRATKAEAELSSLRNVLWHAKVYLWRRQEQSATRTEVLGAMAALRDVVGEHEKSYPPIRTASSCAASTDEEKPR